MYDYMFSIFYGLPKIDRILCKYTSFFGKLQTSVIILGFSIYILGYTRILLTDAYPNICECI